MVLSEAFRIKPGLSPFQALCLNLGERGYLLRLSRYSAGTLTWLAPLTVATHQSLR